MEINSMKHPATPRCLRLNVCTQKFHLPQTTASSRLLILPGSLKHVPNCEPRAYLDLPRQPNLPNSPPGSFPSRQARAWSDPRAFEPCQPHAPLQQPSSPWDPMT